MKTCTNCGESNAQHVTQCHYCKMEQNWSNPTPLEVTTLEKSIKNVTCLNCGQTTSTEKEICECCYFPLQKLMEVKIKNTSQRHLKVA